MDNEYLMEKHQERMCELCEDRILGCCSVSSTFMCEGSRCDEAVELLKDELEEEQLERRIYLLIG